MTSAKRPTLSPLLLTIPEVASTLKIGQTKVRKLIQAGDLPTVRIGRSVRVPAEGLRRWVEEQSR